MSKLLKFPRIKVDEMRKIRGGGSCCGTDDPDEQPPPKTSVPPPPSHATTSTDAKDNSNLFAV